MTDKNNVATHFEVQISPKSMRSLDQANGSSFVPLHASKCSIRTAGATRVYRTKGAYAYKFLYVCGRKPLEKVDTSVLVSAKLRTPPFPPIPTNRARHFPYAPGTIQQF